MDATSLKSTKRSRLAPTLAGIDQHLVAFAGDNREIFQLYGLGKQTTVGADDIA